MHPYRVQMLAEQAVRYAPQEIIEAIRTLRDALWQCIKKIMEYLDVPQSTVYWNSDALAEQLKSIYCELTGEQPPVAKKKAQDSEDSSGKHLNREEIQQYIFEECGFLLRHRIETHLKKCPECVALIEEARKTRDLQQKILQGAQKHVSSEMEVEQSLSHFQDAGRGFPKR